jgi:hypothetical protein
LLTGLTLTAPNGANAVAGGINVLDLPGGAGCESFDGGMAYDFELWNTPTAFYACSYDTGRAAVIQQPIKTLTYYARGVVSLGGRHEVSLEVTGSDANSAKSFSEAQLSANTTNLPIAYPRNAITAPTYDAVFNQIRAAFPERGATGGARRPLRPTDLLSLPLHRLRPARICHRYEDDAHRARHRRSARRRLGLPGRRLLCDQRILLGTRVRLLLPRHARQRRTRSQRAPSARLGRRSARPGRRLQQRPDQPVHHRPVGRGPSRRCRAFRRKARRCTAAATR